MMVFGAELVYAHNTTTDTTSLYVNIFKPQGGLSERFVFSAKDDDTLEKSYQSAPFTSPIFGSGPSFRVPLPEAQQEALWAVASSPEVSDRALERLVTLSFDEGAVLAANRERNRQQAADFQRELDEINEAERSAWRNAQNTIIG
jgi:hypothetical protein